MDEDLDLAWDCIKLSQIAAFNTTSLVAGNASVYSVVKKIHTLANNLHNNVVEINDNQVAQTTRKKKPLV